MHIVGNSRIFRVARCPMLLYSNFFRFCSDAMLRFIGDPPYDLDTELDHSIFSVFLIIRFLLISSIVMKRSAKL